MAEQVTFRELIAHRPLVFAWLWEVVCVVGAIAVMVTTENVPAFFGLILAGGLPFAVVLIRFLHARKQSGSGPKPRSIVE
jgi:choline-glycine betaine transporter